MGNLQGKRGKKKEAAAKGEPQQAEGPPQQRVEAWGQTSNRSNAFPGSPTSPGSTTHGAEKVSQVVPLPCDEVLEDLAPRKTDSVASPSCEQASPNYKHRSGTRKVTLNDDSLIEQITYIVDDDKSTEAHAPLHHGSHPHEDAPEDSSWQQRGPGLPAPGGGSSGSYQQQHAGSGGQYTGPSGDRDHQEQHYGGAGPQQYGHPSSNRGPPVGDPRGRPQGDQQDHQQQPFNDKSMDYNPENQQGGPGDRGQLQRGPPQPYQAGAGVIPRVGASSAGAAPVPRRIPSGTGGQYQGPGGAGDGVIPRTFNTSGGGQSNSFSNHTSHVNNAQGNDVRMNLLNLDGAVVDDRSMDELSLTPTKTHDHGQPPDVNSNLLYTVKTNVPQAQGRGEGWYRSQTFHNFGGEKKNQRGQGLYQPRTDMGTAGSTSSRRIRAAGAPGAPPRLQQPHQDEETASPQEAEEGKENQLPGANREWVETRALTKMLLSHGGLPEEQFAGIIPRPPAALPAAAAPRHAGPAVLNVNVTDPNKGRGMPPPHSTQDKSEDANSSCDKPGGKRNSYQSQAKRIRASSFHHTNSFMNVAMDEQSRKSCAEAAASWRMRYLKEQAAGQVVGQMGVSERTAGMVSRMAAAAPQSVIPGGGPPMLLHDRR
ncbi:unnamed protein product [Amoebophrya sp. A25]|nr:unnamed protein product [Amoebophrya sp. A25]|eukprot:GSA25T00004007001.1